ncbi:hypothetical protein ACGF5O_48695 [Streptomyces sp. NPDC048291]|uniref:hypothetical protein n=1 Tax=Streptomyces sp. NPDC048291 TaxID=3365530 RepID=UPI00371AE5E4
MDMTTALLGSWATSEKTSLIQGPRPRPRRMTRGRGYLACGLGLAEEIQADGQTEPPGRRRDGQRLQAKISSVRKCAEAA